MCDKHSAMEVGYKILLSFITIALGICYYF